MSDTNSSDQLYFCEVNPEGDINRYHAKLRNDSNNSDKDLKYQTVTFYKFVTPEIDQNELQDLRNTIYDYLQSLNILGTILIGVEGVNGTISSAKNIEKAFEFIQSMPQIGKLIGKFSTSEFNPFRKLKIKVRPEIVTLGANKVDVINRTGEHVSPNEWNKLLEDPDVIVIDTRNDFEYKMGTFKNAVNPDTHTFRELPEYVANNLDKAKHKKVAMFCTGGVRCEKSTAYLKEQGFENVYQLDGGILNYFNQMDNDKSLWQGRCFIFDDRIAVDQDVNPVGVPEDYTYYGRRDLMPKDDEY